MIDDDPVVRLKAALPDRYTIERELGAGGMATVYLAHDVKHDRKVALKVLKPELAALVGADRFLAEIRTTANLQHPHILPLFDSGEADGFLYFVMPFVEGESLRDRLVREKQLPVGAAIRIATEVADALEHAHSHGVIHRDIKPANILLRDGRVQVADFGIALAVHQAGGTRLTETGLSVGTPHYMSPEQASGDRQLDGRSDIYSLGCVLYEMLAGEPPHTGPTAQSILSKILTDEPRPVSELRRTVPANVAAAVHVALEKLPADRFSTSRAFAGALADVTYHAGTAVHPGRAAVRARAPSWRTVSIAGALGLAAGAAFAWLVRPVPELAPRTVLLSIESDAAGRIVSGTAALSPDGSVVVYAVQTNAGLMLYRRSLDEVESHPIAGTEGGSNPFFSPNGQQVGFRVGYAIRRVPLAGGVARTVTTFAGLWGGADWGPADEILFVTFQPRGVYTVPADGGAPRVFAELEAVMDTIGIADPAFLPGGRAVLFSAWQGNTQSVGVVTRGTGVVRWLGPGSDPHYVRSGHLVYVGMDGSVYAKPFDAERQDTLGPARRVMEAVGWSDGEGRRLAASSSGSIAFSPASSVAKDLFLLDRAGAGQPLIQDLGFWAPRFSPDGTRIAFAVIPGAKDDIWIHDLGSGTTSRLTLDGQDNNDPVWSPDGRRLVLSRGFGVKDLHFISASGGDPELVLAQDGQQWPTDWSADGQYIVFTNVTENHDIWVLPLAGDGAARPFLSTPFLEGAGRVSPDGRWLAYHSDESGRMEVYVQSFPEPGRKQTVSRDGGQDPIWGPDGRELFYWDLAGQVLMSHEVSTGPDLTLGQRTELFRFPGYLEVLNAHYDVHPDGQRFAVLRKDLQSRLIVAVDLIH